MSCENCIIVHLEFITTFNVFHCFSETCPFTSDSAPESSSNIGLIAGAVAGVLVIAVAVAVGIVLYKKHKARIKPNEHSDEEKVQPPAEPSVTPRDATVIEPPKEHSSRLPPLAK
ncbi:uncharacterized protein [Magallana gigas]|uniref:uncharacterized protein n=1 Tax=Magallana gigas TaxID=29159 RepID=UPI00334085A5